MKNDFSFRKTIGNALSIFAISVITIFSAILWAIFAVFTLPFDYIKYKRSIYYKTEHKKYKWFDATCTNFKIYNAILKNKLPITYYPCPDETDELARGLFVYGKTLIITDTIPSYDTEHDEWVVELSEDNDDYVESLSEFLKKEVAAANDLLKHPICDTAVIIIDIDYLEDDEKAKDIPEIYVYKKSIAEALSKLCENV